MISPELNTVMESECTQLIRVDEDERWNQFVENHPLGWISHLSEWKKILEIGFPHIKGYYFACLDEGQNIRSALPIYAVRSWLTGNRLISVPFSSVCDVLVSTKADYAALIQCAIKLLRETDSKYFEIRVLKSKLPELDQLTCPIPCYYHHSINLETELKELFSSFHRTCIRQRINRAYNSGLDITVGESVSDLRKFYGLYLLNRKRLGLPTQPYRFFKALWSHFYPLGYVRLLIAEKAGTPIGGLLLFLFNNRVSVEFAASDFNYLNLSPNQMLFWEAIQYAKKEKYRTFDFGRTHQANKGLRTFKKRWGTEEVACLNFYYPEKAAMNVYERENSWKYKLTSNLCKNAPVFLQKAIGEFCYCHLG